MPHYPLASGDGPRPIYHAFSVGRVRFLVTDSRSDRTPETMLGEAQREWLKRELLAARDSHALTVWVNSVPWIVGESASGDDWGAYPEERRELADHIAEHGIANLVMLAGDAHMIAFDDGSNSDYASASGVGFPVLHAGALDRPGSTKGGTVQRGRDSGCGALRADDRPRRRRSRRRGALQRKGLDGRRADGAQLHDGRSGGGGPAGANVAGRGLVGAWRPGVIAAGVAGAAFLMPTASDSGDWATWIAAVLIAAGAAALVRWQGGTIDRATASLLPRAARPRA